MSVTRESEDRQKNGCPSRGLGIAAAAIGVGVGAALYYFFNKRAEHPNSEGSTSDWTCERPQPYLDHMHVDTDSYETISEHDTTDTSIHEVNTSFDTNFYNNSSLEAIFIDSSMEGIFVNDSPVGSFFSDSSLESSDGHMSISDSESFDEFEEEYSPTESDSENSFDVTRSSVGIPEDDRSRTSSRSLINRSRASRRSRERSWTLEECSICFDVMLRNQEVTRLSCAHNFHTECILPWLQEKQTCPNCRKVAE